MFNKEIKIEDKIKQQVEDQAALDTLDFALNASKMCKTFTKQERMECFKALDKEDDCGDICDYSN